MDPLTELLGDSPALEAVKHRMRRLLAGIRNASRVPLVLIQGETGTGKGLLARALHNASSRSSRPFVAVNCAAIPETLAESELFGFEAGSHSEARRAKTGLFQAASGGTIFLDEVGLLSEGVQTKLLKVIEDRRVRRVGATRDEPVDVWIISATNSNLQADVQDKKFRADLYQRLAVVRVALPPLRERGLDITRLAEEFIARTCTDYGLPQKQLAEDAQRHLVQHSWPGNVRELSNVIERAVLLSDGELITAASLELESNDPTNAPARSSPTSMLIPLEQSIRDHHFSVLEQTGWNISRSATLLGIARNTLRARIERFGLRSLGKNTGQERMPRGDKSFRFELDSSRGRLDTGREAEAEASSSPDRQQDSPGRAPSVGREQSWLRAPKVAASRGGIGPDLTMQPVGPLRWERRRVTLLRINLALPAGADPLSQGREALNEVLEKAQMFGGRLEGLSATWATFSFGAVPLADSSSRAAHAALSIQRAATRWREREDRGPSVIATLETSHLFVAHDRRAVEVDREGLQMLDRQLVELASRCDTHWIVIGPQIGPFLERRFQLTRIDDRTALSAPAYRLVAPRSPGQSEISETSPLVGREAELTFLKNRWESVLGDHGQIVAVVGEPGVGKSRLLAELCRALADSEVRILHTGALLPNGPSFLPVIDLLRRHLRIDESAAESEVRAKIEQHIAWGGRAEPWSPVALAELLGFPATDPAWAALAPTERRAQTLRALRQIFLAASERSPLVVIFEDLHWVDSETQALIEMLIEMVPAARILLLVAYRPEYRHQWEGRPGYSELWVEPLTREDSTTLLDNLIGSDQTTAPIKDRLIDWTEGNPFFLEEAVRYLVAAGVLAGEQGNYHLTRVDAVPQIPPTVEDVLAERIDRLSPETRAILEGAAVVGLELPLAVLSGVLDESKERVHAGLKALHEAGLLHETGSSSEPEYRFKHQLTHDVTYGNLLHERRRSLHEAVLAQLEVGNPSPQGETLDHLAFHAFHGESWERALVYCRRAGERAYLRSSNAEAVEYFRQSLTCLEHLPESREQLADTVDVLFGLRWALWPQGRLAEMGAALREADRLAARLGDLRRQGMVAAYLADYLWATADNAAALSTGTLALSLAERVGDGILAGQARFGLALAHSALGHYREAAEIVAQAVGPMEDGPPSHQWRVIGMVKAYLARYLAELGEFDRGISYAESGLEAAESAGDSFALLGLLLGLGTLHLRRADMPAAVVVLARGLETARTRGHVNWVPSLSSSLGLAYTLSGKTTEGLDLLTQALTAAESSGIRASQPLWMAYASEGHLLAGRAVSARGLAEQALQLARARGESGHESWALRALSNALAQSDQLDRAIQLMQEALTRAEACGMRPLMARCHNDLSRMLGQCGRRAAAANAREAAAQLWETLGLVGDLTPLEP